MKLSLGFSTGNTQPFHFGGTNRDAPKGTVTIISNTFVQGPNLKTEFLANIVPGTLCYSAAHRSTAKTLASLRFVI